MAQRIEDEEYSPLGEHVVEIPARHHDAPAKRRSYAALGVAAFLTLAGVAIVVGVVEERASRERDERAQRDDLREGWQALSTVAAEGAANEATLQAAAANQPSTPPTVVVVPVQVSPPGAPITVNQALPASTAQSPAPQNAAANQNGMIANGAVPGGVVPAPVPIGGAAAPVNGAAVAAPGNGAVAPPQGVAPATNGVPAAPVGTVPATNPTQPVPANTAFPATQACGITSCDLGSVCCNASCGICAPPGASCSQIQCG